MNTDPIIAKIRKQRQLYQSWTAAIDTDDENCTVAWTIHNAAFKKLVRTKPRTRDGAAALVRYCLVDDACFPDRHADALVLLRTLAKALPALT